MSEGCLDLYFDVLFIWLQDVSMSQKVVKLRHQGSLSGVPSNDRRVSLSTLKSIFGDSVSNLKFTGPHGYTYLDVRDNHVLLPEDDAEFEVHETPRVSSTSPQCGTPPHTPQLSDYAVGELKL